MMRSMKEYLDMGKIEDHGLTRIHTYFRTQGHASPGNDIMYGIKLVDPAG